MAAANLAVVVLAAGLGTRMRSKQPKVMHEVARRPMVGHVAAALQSLRPARVVLVVGPEMDDVAAAALRAAPKLKMASVVQRQRRGTGHAVLQARRTLAGFRGDVLIVLGDAPLVRADTLSSLLARRRQTGAAVAVLAMRLDAPGSYGRLVTDGDTTLERIVEASDANEDERAIDLCNGGIVAADGRVLFELLASLKPDNAKREYYLTDIVALARDKGHRCTWLEAPAEELLAVNTRVELAAVEAVMQNRLRIAAMENGATLIDPTSAFLASDTVLGRDVTIGPSVFFGPGVWVGDGVEIRAFCHIEGAHIAPGAVVGPFARLRPGAEIGAGAHIGNYVEVKNMRVGAGAKANHLAYLGDGTVGAQANIGAGTITCNYDGVGKNRTEIGAGAFIGSNATLIAPVRIGAGAFVAGGSTITRHVAPDALAFGRARQETVSGGAKALRKTGAKKKKS
jgi:bifunctional UDP-N-acetylglucosamine pyrophosphorylase/glucosamine-1-phosphate N-acetyltransferase